MPSLREMCVLIRGAGDLASGAAARLHRSRFSIVMTELPEPLMVRRKVSFGEAIYDGQITVEELVARRADNLAEARSIMAAGQIPVLVDPEATCRRDLQPSVIVDAIMSKQNTNTAITDAPLVIALGPGFTAGVDCHAIVETQRGHWLGRVIWNGLAASDTGVPGEIGSQQAARVLRAPDDGIFEALASIGDQVKAGQVVARVGANEICAGCDGVVRGLIRSGRRVTARLKVGDVDPRAEIRHCFTFSDKSLAVGGGVLEAILHSYVEARSA